MTTVEAIAGPGTVFEMACGREVEKADTEVRVRRGTLGRRLRIVPLLVAMKILSG